jgi:hypothetical protein
LNQVQTCQGNQWVTTQTCTDPQPFCYNGACAICQPNLNYCVGNQVYSCTAQGTQGSLVTTCGTNEDCVSGICTSPCQVAEATNSYIGCEYFPTPTVNSQLDAAFDNNFGVVVHNANNTAAQVTIQRGGATVAQQDVEAGQLYTFELPYVTELKGSLGADVSSLVTSGAYHLTSSLPVTVYQFNPLDFETGSTFSHTNDASLLLPRHVLSNNYIVMARQTFGVDTSGFGMFSFIPGFFAVVGTEANTQVTVQYSANTTAGTGVNAATPGSSQTYTLNVGDVLQVVSGMPGSCSGTTSSDDCNGIGGTCSYCDMGTQYDLTGTRISSTARVAVFSGHVCSFVPYNYWACDHLEEQMMPLETWGKEYIVGRTAPQNDTSHSPEPNVIRILSGDDGNVINFNPGQSIGGSVTLNQGEWREFLATENFRVTGEKAFMVAQFLVGQNYYSSGTEYWGDPGYSLVVPIEQFRTSYTFLAPSTITYNYVNITKRVIEGSAPVYLDGSPVSESAFSSPIGGTEWASASIPISGTFHSIESTQTFGITVYGFASYTSYSYPGGLDLKFINPVD